MQGWISLINILNWGVSTEIVLPVPLMEQPKKRKWRVGLKNHLISSAYEFSKCKIIEKGKTYTCKFTMVFTSWPKYWWPFEQFCFSKTIEIEGFKWCSLVLIVKPFQGLDSEDSIIHDKFLTKKKNKLWSQKILFILSFTVINTIKDVV